MGRWAWACLLDGAFLPLLLRRTARRVGLCVVWVGGWVMGWTRGGGRGAWPPKGAGHIYRRMCPGQDPHGARRPCAEEHFSSVPRASLWGLRPHPPASLCRLLARPWRYPTFFSPARTPCTGGRRLTYARERVEEGR